MIMFNPLVIGGKSEIRISKLETNSNDQKSKQYDAEINDLIKEAAELMNIFGFILQKCQ